MIAGIALLVVVLGPSARFWPGQVTVPALVAGVLTLFALSSIPIYVPGILGALGAVREPLIGPLTGACTLLVALIALVAGMALAAVGKLRGRGDLAVSGLLMVLVTVVVIAASLNQIQADLGRTLLPQPTHIPRGMEVLVAFFLLLQLTLLALRRQPLATWPGALAGPFIALVGLFAISWYGGFLFDQGDSGPSSIVLLAVIFLAQELWDVARSGEQITNADSPSAPRSSRVQVYFGYVLVAAAFFLYGSTLRIQQTGAVVSGDLTGVSNDSAATGILVLGFALVLVTGLTRAQQGRAVVLAPAEMLVPTRNARRSLIGVLGVGSALVVALIVVIVAVIIPRAQVSARTTYFTHLPGPNCDTQGATWTQDPRATLVCDPTDGLHVTIAGKDSISADLSWISTGLEQRRLPGQCARNLWSDAGVRRADYPQRRCWSILFSGLFRWNLGHFSGRLIEGDCAGTGAGQCTARRRVHHHCDCQRGKTVNRSQRHNAGYRQRLAVERRRHLPGRRGCELQPDHRHFQRFFLHAAVLKPLLSPPHIRAGSTHAGLTSYSVRKAFDTSRLPMRSFSAAC